MGWDKREEQPEEAATGAIRRELVALGLTNRRVDELFSEYGVDQAARQLAWLPHRHAKNPARMIVAAIEGSYS